LPPYGLCQLRLTGCAARLSVLEQRDKWHTGSCRVSKYPATMSQMNVYLCSILGVCVVILTVFYAWKGPGVTIALVLRDRHQLTVMSCHSAQSPMPANYDMGLLTQQSRRGVRGCQASLTQSSAFLQGRWLSGSSEILSFEHSSNLDLHLLVPICVGLMH
jgi:hypothetical protein